MLTKKMADDHRNGKKNFQFVFAGDDLVNSSRSQKGWVFFFSAGKKMHSLPPKTSKLPFNRSWWAGLSEGSNSIKITNLFWKISTIPPQNYCVGSNPNIENFRTWQIIELQIGSSTKKEFQTHQKSPNFRTCYSRNHMP